MAIHWALDRLERLFPAELFAKLADVSCNPAVPIDAGGNYPIIHGETGEMITGVPYAKGLRVPRSKMRALSAEGIEVQVARQTPSIAIPSIVVNTDNLPTSTGRTLSTSPSTRAATG